MQASIKLEHHVRGVKTQGCIVFDEGFWFSRDKRICITPDNGLGMITLVTPKGEYRLTKGSKDDYYYKGVCNGVPVSVAVEGPDAELIWLK